MERLVNQMTFDRAKNRSPLPGYQRPKVRLDGLRELDLIRHPSPASALFSGLSPVRRFVACSPHARER
jgi:hypothetical protein